MARYTVLSVTKLLSQKVHGVAAQHFKLVSYVEPYCSGEANVISIVEQALM